MDFKDFIKLPDKERIFLINCRLAKEIQPLSWTATGSGSYWCDFTWGEVVAVKEMLNSSGAIITYTEVGTVGNCDSTTSSFFYDHTDAKLYVHTSGNDSPATADKYTILAYLYIGFSNELVVYGTIQYLPYLDVSKMPVLTQAVGDYHVGSIKTQFGSLSFLNDGWWYTALENFLWHNKEIDILCGKKGSDYDEFGHIFAGRIRDPEVGDKDCVMGIKDRRVGAFRQLPKNKFWSSDSGYEDLEEGAEGNPKPIPFGELYNVSPVFIKTDGSTYWRYFLSEYAIESVLDVYKGSDEVDKVTLVSGTDYNAYPANGYFDLLEDPGDMQITCDIKGVKCDFDTGAYSENIADILYFILNQENDFDWETLDKVSFDDLKAGRTQAIAYHLSDSISTLNFIRLLQATGIFQFVPKPDGSYGAYHYKSGVVDDAPRLYNEDYDNLKKEEQTGAIYKKVVIKYAKDPTTGSWKSVEKTEPKVGHRYGEEKTLTIETALRDKAEAESLASFYLSLVHAPLAKLEGKITSVALGFKPSDKIVVSKQIIGGEGEEIEVFGESPNYAEVYRILELRKDLRSAKVGILALEDDQSIGGDHANVAHENTHTDTHNDSLHENEHSDGPHSNEPHQDEHGNTQHWDLPYGDHFDYPQPYLDEMHVDVPYVDSHSNVPHDNTIHSNSHDDDAYSDSHIDTHNNVPHSDSSY